MTETTTQRGPCKLIMGGKAYTTEREVTRVDDWRETPFGRVNFGYVMFGPVRIRVEDHRP